MNDFAFPISSLLTAEELLELRTSDAGSQLRFWLRERVARGIETDDSDHIPSEVVDELTAASAVHGKTKLLVDCGVAGLATGVGYVVSGWPGALAGSIGRIPLGRAVDRAITKAVQRRVNVSYDFLKVRHSVTTLRR